MAKFGNEMMRNFDDEDAVEPLPAPQGPPHIRTSSLQLLISDWIKREGGEFGDLLKERSIATEKYVITVNTVSYQMAQAACAVYEGMAQMVDADPRK